MMEEMAAYYAPPAAAQPPQQSPSDMNSSYYTTHYHPLPPPPPPPHYSHHPHTPLPSSFSHHHHHHPPPLPPPSHTSHDEVRTLFVAGLPQNVKPREVYNLFRDFPGYLSSNLRSPSKTSQPFAFAEFLDQHSAVTAMHALNGMVFDLEEGSTLYIDLAKSNSRSKRQRGDDGPVSDKKHKGSPGFPRGSVDLGIGSFHIHGMGNSAYDTIGYPSAQSHRSYTSRGTSEANASHSSASHVPQDNPPCPTIFVANLSPNCSEQELTQVFSRCRGFLKLKIQSTYGAPVAFVDFQDTACSTEALAELQGTVLFSAPDGVGMRLEYAKSRMGKRRKTK